MTATQRVRQQLRLVRGSCATPLRPRLPSDSNHSPSKETSWGLSRLSYVNPASHRIASPSQTMDNLYLSESDPHRSEPEKRRLDQMLHQRLSEIFRERCRSDSSLIKEFLRAPEHAVKNSIIDLILDQHPVFSKQFIPEQLKKLSLLWIAVLESYHKSAELIVRSGADVNKLYGLPTHCSILGLKTNSTVLHALLVMDPSDENERLIRLVTGHGANLQARDSKNRTVLHSAVEQGRVQVTQMFLEKAAVDNVNVVNDTDNKEGNIPLLIAAESSKADELVPLLVKYGADLQARDNLGRTVLHLVTMKSLVHVAEMLLEKGADLRARDSRGQTVLNLAVEQGQVQMTRMFLEKAAVDNVNFVNNADNIGIIPLLVAAGSSKADELVPLLMKYGADVSVKDARGRNVLHWLSRNCVEHVDLARDLIERGASLDDREYRTQCQPLHKSIVAKHNKLVMLYLDHGANVNSLVNDGVSPLHIAAEAGGENSASVVKTLLERGADMDIDRRTISKGRTPLHLACKSLKDKHIRLLLCAGADVLVEDHNGNTPFALLLGRADVNRSSYEPMIKALAVNKFFRSTIESKDEKIIERFPVYHNCFRNCVEQIERMKSARFIETCTLFDLISKHHCQIAALMRNPNFEINFNNCDLSGFSSHAKEIRWAFENAKKHYQSVLDQEDLIDEAVYHILPYEVVRRIGHYICHCCEHMYD